MDEFDLKSCREKSAQHAVYRDMLVPRYKFQPVKKHPDLNSLDAAFTNIVAKWWAEEERALLYGTVGNGNFDGILAKDNKAVVPKSGVSGTENQVRLKKHIQFTKVPGFGILPTVEFLSVRKDEYASKLDQLNEMTSRAEKAEARVAELELTMLSANLQTDKCLTVEQIGHHAKQMGYTIVGSLELESKDKEIADLKKQLALCEEMNAYLERALVKSDKVNEPLISLAPEAPAAADSTPLPKFTGAVMERRSVAKLSDVDS